MDARRRILYILVSVLAWQFVGCCAFRLCYDAEERRLDDIREVVFRYQFENSDPVKWERNWVYFLQLMPGRKSPSERFMKRFAGHVPPVKPLSDCVIVKRNGTVIDKETGEQGIIFCIVEIKWVDEYKVEVDGSFYVANLCGEGHIYSVEWKDGAWVVTKDVMYCIS
jgi:hypothetical protein